MGTKLFPSIFIKFSAPQSRMSPLGKDKNTFLYKGLGEEGGTGQLIP